MEKDGASRVTAAPGSYGIMDGILPQDRLRPATTENRHIPVMKTCSCAADQWG